MSSQALSRVLIASILLGISVSTSFAQNDDSDFIKIRNSYPFWNGSLKRDIQGFKPGMTESEAKQALSGCEVSGHKILCPGALKDESFELSLTEHTTPRVVKDVTYVFPGGGATLETMAKNVVVQFGVGNSQQCRGALKTLVGREPEELHIFETEELSVDPGSPRVNVSTDGEVTIMDAPLRFRIRPGALGVLTPAGSRSAPVDG
jgi:hypothetical protein